MTLKIDQAIELISAWRGKSLSFKPIYGGITNQNFKVIVDQEPYFLSIANNDSELLGVNLFNKHFNNKVCDKLELSPKIIHFLQSEGVLVSEFFPLPTLSNESLHKFDVQKRLIIAIKKLHRGPNFMGTFDMFNLIKSYLKIAKLKDIKFPDDFEDCLIKANIIGKALEPYRKKLVPCHNDLTAENMLDDGQKIYLIDFDYSGQNDLFFELGNLCVEAKFNDIQTRELLINYFGQINEEIVSKTHLHGVLSDIGWSLWSFVQIQISEIDFDFMSYGLKRWKKAVYEIKSGKVDKWLQYI